MSLLRYFKACREWKQSGDVALYKLKGHKLALGSKFDLELSRSRST